MPRIAGSCVCGGLFCYGGTGAPEYGKGGGRERRSRRTAEVGKVNVGAGMGKAELIIIYNILR